MKSWRSMIFIVGIGALITIFGTIFGVDVETMGTLRERFTGKNIDLLVDEFGPPLKIIRIPIKPANTYIYGNIVSTTKGPRVKQVLFDLDPDDQITEIYASNLNYDDFEDLSSRE